MNVFGLTGGVGMGKSTAGDLLQQRGLAVVDTDALAREVVEPGQPALVEIEQVFGGEILDAGGRLCRDELARRIFADEMLRRRLETITHPRIRARWLAQIETWRAEDRPAGVVIIPLLFETNAAAQVNHTICVACSAASQRQRLHARGWTPEQIELRIRAQWPSEKKMAAADFVVWNEGGRDVLEEQLRRVIPA